MADKNLREIETTLSFGELLANIGVSLPRAQQRIDEAALRQIFALADMLPPADPGKPGYDPLAVAAGRASFYAIPSVKVEMRVAFQYSRQKSGGVLSCIFGGRSGGEQKETTSTVSAELVAMPAPPELADMIREHTADVQCWLIDFAEANPTVLPSASVPACGDWTPAWAEALKAFQRWWNAQDPGRELGTLPDTGTRDDDTLAALEGWHRLYFVEDLSAMLPLVVGCICSIGDLNKTAGPLLSKGTFEAAAKTILGAFRKWYNGSRPPDEQLADADKLDRATFQAVLETSGCKGIPLFSTR